MPKVGEWGKLDWLMALTKSNDFVIQITRGANNTFGFKLEFKLANGNPELYRRWELYCFKPGVESEYFAKHTNSPAKKCEASELVGIPYIGRAIKRLSNRMECAVSCFQSHDRMLLIFRGYKKKIFDPSDFIGYIAKKLCGYLSEERLAMIASNSTWAIVVQNTLVEGNDALMVEGANHQEYVKLWVALEYLGLSLAELSRIFPRDDRYGGYHEAPFATRKSQPDVDKYWFLGNCLINDNEALSALALLANKTITVYCHGEQGKGKMLRATYLPDGNYTVHNP